MSLDPNLLLNSLHFHSESGANLLLTGKDATWLLAQLKHRDDQIQALKKLVKPAPAAPPRETICQEADRIVSHDRGAAYGTPKDDFSRTAAMWEPILGLPPGGISPEQIGLCMIAVKLSRLTHGYKRDSVVDIAGYAKCIAMIHEDPL